MLNLKAKRREKLAERPFPPDWAIILQKRVPHYSDLPALDREKLKSDIQIFCAEKRFEGCAGLTVTDEMRVVIAAQACLLTLHRDADFYPNVSSILVYPSAFTAKYHPVPGVVGHDENELDGESWHHDLVILSWDEVRRAARDSGDGVNLVFHEFAHQLDYEGDAAFNGTPLLPNRAVYRAWRAVFEREFQNLREADARGEDPFLDPYGATHPAEFFAVCTETFFECPREMKEKHPSLFELLKIYFQQDPLTGPEAGTRRVVSDERASRLISEHAASPDVEDHVLREGTRTLRGVLVLVAILAVLGVAARLGAAPGAMRIMLIGGAAYGLFRAFKALRGRR